MCSLLSGRHGSRWQVWLCSILMIASLAIIYTLFPTVGQVVFGQQQQQQQDGIEFNSNGNGQDDKALAIVPDSSAKAKTKNATPKTMKASLKLKGMPSILFDKNLYSKGDFLNEAGIVPSFWNETVTCTDSGDDCKEVWGPCYPPAAAISGALNWDHTIDTLGGNNMDKLQYLNQKSNSNLATNTKWSHDLSNFCRPGFLIIGQGKCGTSSLYHYLTDGHPRVLPANQKQIHYFKYYARQGLKWYLGHFPSAESFLANGALMTGEASPGYLPYPDVVALTKREMSGTKIICVGRDPMERAYSSYRYNYVNPAMDAMRKGKGSFQGIGRHQSKEYYKQYLHSFEDMMRAELTILQECLSLPDGIGITGAKAQYGHKHWAQPEYSRREALDLPPLVDLDGQCYGGFLTKEVPRKQWNDLAKAKPGKFLNVPALHLSQAMIGRSLYVYPLEWWYALFQEDDDSKDDMLYFLCTEEMRDMSGEGIAKVGRFLGLPEHNFSDVVSQGMFNVGGHKGYDKVTSWDTAEEEHEESEKEVLAEEEANAAATNATEAPGTEPIEEGIPLSDEFKKELLEFLKPHNERLFALVGRRCNWAS